MLKNYINLLISLGMVLILASTAFADQRVSASLADTKAIQATLLKDIPASDQSKFVVCDVKVIGKYASAYRAWKNGEGETDFCLSKRAENSWKQLDCGSGVFYDKPEWVSKGVPARLFDNEFKVH